jgi:hypothetical protein
MRWARSRDRGRAPGGTAAGVGEKTGRGRGPPRQGIGRAPGSTGSLSVPERPPLTPGERPPEAIHSPRCARESLTIVPPRSGVVPRRSDGVRRWPDGVPPRLDGGRRRLDGVRRRLDGAPRRFDGVRRRLDGARRRPDGRRAASVAAPAPVRNPPIPLIAAENKDLALLWEPPPRYPHRDRQGAGTARWLLTAPWRSRCGFRRPSHSSARTARVSKRTRAARVSKRIASTRLPFLLTSTN